MGGPLNPHPPGDELWEEIVVVGLGSYVTNLASETSIGQRNYRAHLYVTWGGRPFIPLLL